MATILRITADDYESAIDVADPLLHSGGLLVYPTDTVYGIGGRADSAEVVRQINAIKGSEPAKPLSVMVSGFDMIDEYCETGVWEDIIIKKYLPGPYTFILKTRKPLAAAGGGKLGIRMPDSEFCRELCRRFEAPIITTSANLVGGTPPARFEDIDRRILDGVQVAIDGGVTKYRGPSNIVDLVDRKLIRPGGETISLVEGFRP